MGDWKPGASNADWLIPAQWVIDEPLPETPVTVPVGNGMPELVPYRYGGTDFSVPAAVTVAEAPAARRPRRRRRRPVHDPEWLAADLPLSTPAEWIHEFDLEAS